MQQTEARLYRFYDDGVIPNHPTLPVVLLPGALKGRAGEAEQVFRSNGWGNSWTGGVFDYHHYHSNTHEALAVTAGSAVLQLGGEQGKELEVKAGDVLVLPAGTGHKKLSASADFEVAGAYPGGMEYNLHTGKAGERPAVLEEIRRVPPPSTDPVEGANGPLIRAWAELPGGE
ncbi:hypothetical protein J31TS4_37560 [Paenibacillus sp. J31TS4]|uniref:cupin domain-containing protein n=1 Tax=Paenibacillus sp. J31TS4 TaxID=2807195 RepID=UPI001B239999|nr:cupin domain-containing protein [Paenibacillus sp. J31TS4]GIP40476.1 hypothetical protein J31TS4_37560 [Paenibacillus sp. J31TS4]